MARKAKLLSVGGVLGATFGMGIAMSLGVAIMDDTASGVTAGLVIGAIMATALSHAGRQLQADLSGLRKRPVS